MRDDWAIESARPQPKTTRIGGRRRNSPSSARRGRSTVEDRDERRGHEREEPRRGERVPPAPRPRDRRQEERRRQPAQGEAGLLHAHRDPSLARRKPLHHGPARRGIQHAEAESAEHQQDEQQPVVRAPGRERDHGADQELAEREREAYSEAVGEPARRQSHQHAAQIDRREKEPDLHARERERLEEKRGQRRHGQGGERAEGMRHGHERQDRPPGCQVFSSQMCRV
jgi:hypothetical protein